MAEINLQGGGEERVCKTFIHRFDSGPRLHSTPTNQSTSTEVSANAPGVNRDRHLATFGDVPDENRTAPCCDCGGVTDQITATRVPDGRIACLTCADFLGKCCLCGGRWPHADLDFAEEDIRGVDHFVCRACSGLRPESPAPVLRFFDGRATSEDDDEFLRSTRKYVEADYRRAWAERYPSTARVYAEAYGPMRPIRKVVRCA